MTLIHNHQIERLRCQRWAIGHCHRLPRHVAVKPGIIGVHHLQALENLDDTLNGRDDDLARANHPSTGELVDVVELGEFPAVIWVV